MQILTFSTNLEHIGDHHRQDLMEMASKKIWNQDNFSRQGFTEISDLHHRVVDNMALAQNVFMTGDVAMARKLFEEKSLLREQEMNAAESHFKRLSAGVAETIRDLEPAPRHPARSAPHQQLYLAYRLPDPGRSARPEADSAETSPRRQGQIEGKAEEETCDQERFAGKIAMK